MAQKFSTVAVADARRCACCGELDHPLGLVEPGGADLVELADVSWSRNVEYMLKSLQFRMTLPDAPPARRGEGLLVVGVARSGA